MKSKYGTLTIDILTVVKLSMIEDLPIVKLLTVQL